MLVDTGGIRPGAGGIEALAARKSYESFGAAACIILLLDIEELTGEDEEVIASLRPCADRVIVAVNKADTGERESALGDFWALGFPRVFAVSSAHGRGCEELAEAVFGSVDFSLYGEGASGPGADITLAILGKPNTGKSTLINHFLGEERSIVSSVPGTTRDVVDGYLSCEGRVFRLLDTAGIRRKARVTENIEYYSVNRAIASIEEADVVLLLIDACQGLAEQDKKIAAQIVKKGRGVILVLNKWDLVPSGGGALTSAVEKVRFLFPVLEFAPVMAASAATGWNTEALLSRAWEIKGRLERRVETSVLNKALERWVGENPPPRDGKRQYKIKFMTQVKAAPLRFVLFVNRVGGFPASYLGYIKNRLRAGFDFADVPLEVELRGREGGGARKR
jgi:GTP-binding protein